MKKEIIIILMGIFLIGLASAADNATVCCEKTTSGLLCQDVPATQCEEGARQVPTACQSTSYCKPGYCYDSVEGTCLDKTPQLVCNQNNGTWSETFPTQCNLGCCVLGDQASFVSLVRCKRLSSFLGLKTNYNTEIKDEVACVLSVQNKDKGACVYDYEFERTCKFTTREECNAGLGNDVVNDSGIPQFYKDKLCSAEELGTNCGPTKQTTCLAGRDGVYFVDSCGNPANIYDSTKINDKEYWTNVKNVDESCNPESGNANSAACGNCNYALGSFCRQYDSTKNTRPTYGDNICADLNCKTAEGTKRHGESWCSFGGIGTTDKGVNSVGSRFYKEVCVNGEVLVEPCADFRQEACLEETIDKGGEFSQAACRPNRWQECTTQQSKASCENTDKRDCFWVEGYEMQGSIIENNTILDSSGKAKDMSVSEATGDTTKEEEERKLKLGGNGGVCLPMNPPGLQTWDGSEAKNICNLANYRCNPKFEKGLFGEEKCVSNCECLEDGWEKERIAICQAMGDCGPGVNWIGEAGYNKGYKKVITEESKKKFLGIF